MKPVVAVLLSVAVVPVAYADVFNMPPGQTSLVFVRVGDPGNTGELSGASAPGGSGPDGIVGAVNYGYDIGTFEITVAQYTQFLNSVAATDSYGLYSPTMETDGRIAGIARQGSPGSHVYSVIGSPNHPVTNLNWGDAARFANWLSNGQPVGVQSPATTEDGSYFLNGSVSDTALMAVTRKPRAKYAIPTEHEWYKAAYYDPTPGAGNALHYWLYPMKTNAVPFSDEPPGSGAPNAQFTGNFYRDDNMFNGYDDGFAVTASAVMDFNRNYLTNVGAYISASSFYGTFDQGGNVWEWNEAIVLSDARGVRGGSWFQFLDETSLRSVYRPYYRVSSETIDVGFRIVRLDECALLGDIDRSGRVDGDDIAGFVRAKYGVPLPTDAPECANYGTGTVQGDIGLFVHDLLN